MVSPISRGSGPTPLTCRSSGPNGVTKEIYTPEEAEAAIKAAAAREAEQTEPGTTADVHYDFSQFGLDRSQSKFAMNLRTSLIVDPADGKMPPVNAQGQKRAQERAAARKAAGGQYDAVREHADRLALHHHGRSRPAADERRLQRQLPDRAVAGLRDDSHRDDSRRAHHPARQSSAAAVAGAPVGGPLARTLGRRHAGRRDDELQRQEPVQRREREPEGHRTVHAHRRRHRSRYKFTVEDPTTWDRSWTADAPLVKTEGPIFEFACHETNYGIANILAGARADEKKAAEQKKGSN